MYQITSKKQFDELVSKTSHLVVVKFGAVWCGPCKTMAPVVKAVAEKYPNVLFLDVDVDKVPDVANEYHVSSIPYFVFIKNKKIVYTTSGAMQGTALEKLITTHK